MSMCVCAHMCVCVHAFVGVGVCMCVCDNSKKIGSIHLKPDHIVVHKNSSNEFDIGHCPIKVSVTV